MARKAPVRVRMVVCFSCTKGLLKKKPVELTHLETIEAKGLKDHLVGTFQCDSCGTVVGFIYQPVKIFKDGTVVSRSIEEYRLDNK